MLKLTVNLCNVVFLTFLSMMYTGIAICAVLRILYDLPREDIHVDDSTMLRQP